MKRYWMGLLGVSCFLFSSSGFAQGVKFVTTGTAGSQHDSDVPYEGDPLQGKKGVDPKWDQGAPSTQQPYTDDCKDDRCVRAEKRQLGDTTWEQDRASGLHKSSNYPATGEAKSTTSTTSSSSSSSSGSTTSGTAAGSTPTTPATTGDSSAK